MSLIHWWPLNGDTQDKIGNNNLQYINSSGKIVINNSGKLGKCYERTAVGASDLLRSNATMKVFTEESICAWVYVSQHAALNTANGVVTNHDHGSNSGLGIGVYSSDGTNYYISINAGNGSGRIHSTYWGQTNIKDAWHHVCLVSDGSIIRMYVDGKEDRAAVNYSVYSKADYLDIFCWSTGYYNQTSYRPACKVCDVRVYDHALSQAEVKELSRALVVHYTFDDNMLTTHPQLLQNEVGYNQPITVSNIALTEDFASGSYSLNCTGNTMINTPVTGDVTSGTTISCWVKTPTYPSANAIVFADYNSKLAFGFYNTQSAIISCGGYSAPYISNIKSSWIDGWNHVVVTKDSGGTISCYLNGVKLSTTGSNNWSATSGYSTIGGRYNGSYTTYFTGYVDDYRVYHTLLSETDIQDLYKTKACITDRGDMITHNYIENCNDLQVTNTYNAETQEIQEIGNDEYEQLEYIASTGTQYIDTGVYWTSEKATIVADLEITTFKGSTTIFGSEERYSGSSRYFAHILHAGSANGNYANYIGTASRGTATSLTKDTRYILEYIAHGDNTFSTKTTNHTTGEIKVYNNKVSYTGTILTRQNSTQTAANRGHIYIFSNHNAYNGTDGIQKMAAMKLYHFTMIQDDIYIRDFIPCRRKSDSKVGLFDMVTGQFYTSPVDNFTAGGVVTNEDATVKFLSGGTIQARQFIEI